MENPKTEIVLQDWVLAEIKRSWTLKGLVADELGISPRTLEDILPQNPKRLTQAGVLRILKAFLQQGNKDIKYIDLIQEKTLRAA